MSNSLLAKFNLLKLLIYFLYSDINIKINMYFQVKLFAPQIWNQTVRHRGKYNVKMPHPRHEIARHLEELTKPVIIKELPDPIEMCLDQKSRIAKRLKFSSNQVHI